MAAVPSQPSPQNCPRGWWQGASGFSPRQSWAGASAAVGRPLGLVTVVEGGDSKMPRQQFYPWAKAQIAV